MRYLLLLILFFLPACALDYDTYAKQKAALKYKCPTNKIAMIAEKRLSGDVSLVHLAGCGKEFKYICSVEVFSCTASECYEVVEK